MNKVVKAVNSSKEYGITVSINTEMMKEIVAKHNLVCGFSNVLSDAINANILLCSNLKDEREEIGMVFNTNGYMSQVISHGNYNNEYSGYAILSSDMSSKVGIIGDNGVLNVTRYFDGKEIQNSQIAIETNSVGDIMVDYFYQSEQIYSVVLFASLVDKKTNEIYATGSMMIQLLPNCSEETIATIENIISEFGSLSEKIMSGNNEEDIIRLIDKEAHILESKEIKFYCGCSKEKTLSSLKLIADEELKEILAEDGKIQAVCNFCNHVYVYYESDLFVH